MRNRRPGAIYSVFAISVCVSLLAAGSGLASGVPPSVASAVNGRPPPAEEACDGGLLFVFATIADSHIRLNEAWDDRGFIKATGISSELLTNYVRDINVHEPPVEFVVHLGDITDYGLPDEFAAAMAILDGLRCPLYPVVGNHDVFRGEGKDGLERLGRTGFHELRLRPQGISLRGHRLHTRLLWL